MRCRTRRLQGCEREGIDPTSDRPLGLPYVLVPSAVLRALVPNGEEWAGFHRRYPDSGGYMQVSAVGFDNSKTHALVSMAHHCGPLCGRGTHHVLEEVDS